jgi:site-specific DNA-adenine methylase
MESTPVAPVRPAAPYIGGKRNLARRLVELIDADAHHTYAEPFVGMGGVFLRRRQRAKAEVINDWSRDVSNFYRVLQVHYVAFLDMIRFQMRRYDGPETLFYLDPPYWGSERDYGADLFDRDQFEPMAAQLAALQGRFVMSINDVAEVRSIFRSFDLVEVTTTYQISGEQKPARELIVRNQAEDERQASARESAPQHLRRSPCEARAQDGRSALPRPSVPRVA